MKTKRRFKYITINFLLGEGAEAVKKSQQIPICSERLAALSSGSKSDETAINDIVKNIALLCGQESFTIRSVEGIILGGDDE